MKKKGDFCVMNDNQLKAVHDDDLKTLLVSLNCFDKINNRQCKCIYCDDIIEIDTLGAIVPKDGEIQFTCNKAECLNKLTDMGD